MSYLALSSNETVSFNDLQDAVTNGYLYLRNTIPSSNELVTKADANYYVWIDTTVSSYAALTSLEEVTKADLVSRGIPYVLSWSYTKIGAGSGSLEIIINGSSALYTTTTGDSGNITVFDTDSVYATVVSNAGVCFANIVQNGTPYNNSGTTSCTVSSTAFSPSGDFSISGTASDNS